MGRSSTRGVSARQSHPDSFDDVTAIPSLPDVQNEHEAYLPPDAQTKTMMKESRTRDEATPKKNYDYSVSRSEPQPSPFDKFRNFAVRRPTPWTRTLPVSHHLVSYVVRRDATQQYVNGISTLDNYITFVRSSDPVASLSNRVSCRRDHDDVETGEVAGEEEPLTPHTRRRSFLFSVINSTTRPRLEFPTPHPRATQHVPLSDTDAADRPAPTPGPGPRLAALGTPALRPAFAGATPRIPVQGAAARTRSRRRTSPRQRHPTLSLPWAPVAAEVRPGAPPRRRTTPVERLRKAEEERRERLASAGRRVSVGGTALGNMEDAAEEWLEEMVETFKE
ncbi:hypothetical protein B0H11DRAFT_2248435 [Mycena galericulata]|nr:hypothetical protein B0H11DRAFT_2248435 [Mycena galericulata]